MQKNMSISADNIVTLDENLKLNSNGERSRTNSVCSSKSSNFSDSDTLLDNASFPEHLQEHQKDIFGHLRIRANADKKEKTDFHRYRSHSEGLLKQKENIDDKFQVFPNLSDNVLQKMNLLNHHNIREHFIINDEEIEQKFLSLAMAFTIDATSIEDRCKRQRRSQDQTESNLTFEIERLTQKAKRLQLVCTDFESTELLSTLMDQIELVTSAIKHATISAERYGAVQHECRLSDAVNLIIRYVNVLKKQRDGARRQLQYTKKVLQNSFNTWTPHMPHTGRALNKRRASIAAMAQAPDKLSRAPSFRVRASSLVRNVRPSRLELSFDLVKIKEGIVENTMQSSRNHKKINHCAFQSMDTDFSSKLIQNGNNKKAHENATSLRINRLLHYIKKLYGNWIENGTLHELYYCCALTCFSISIVLMANVLSEIEMIRKSSNSTNFFCVLR